MQARAGLLQGATVRSEEIVGFSGLPLFLPADPGIVTTATDDGMPAGYPDPLLRP